MKDTNLTAKLIEYNELVRKKNILYSELEYTILKIAKLEKKF